MFNLFQNELIQSLKNIEHYIIRLIVLTVLAKQ